MRKQDAVGVDKDVDGGEGRLKFYVSSGDFEKSVRSRETREGRKIWL